MTDVTRRDALMLTAAVAAVTSPSAFAQAQSAITASADEINKLLIVPTAPVANSSIPVSIKIPATSYAPDGGNPTSLEIVLKISDKPDDPNKWKTVLTATLKDMAIPPASKNGDKRPDIVMMTRLRIPPGSDKDQLGAKDQSGAIRASVKTNYTTKDKDGKDIAKTAEFQPQQTITTRNEDCAPPEVANLRLSLQPAAVTPNSSIIIRAIVPPVAMQKKPGAVQPQAANPAPPGGATPATPVTLVPTHHLSTITCTANNKVLEVKDISDAYLSAEVFVGLGIFPGNSGALKMEWAYLVNADALPKPPPPPPYTPPSTYTLTAVAYAVVVPNAAG
jgi:hypothetical protein